MEWKEFTAKTVNEALTSALIEFDVPSDKVEYEVIETEPAVKGNTTNNALKDAYVETGMLVRVPLFIEQGEKILVTTADGKYSSRA